MATMTADDRLTSTDTRRHASLKDTAYDYLRDAIVSGRYGPGAKVDQDEIASVLGVSRLPVREALIELAQKGFVEAIPRRGAFVASLEIEDIEDHFEALGLLFALAARRAAKVMDVDTLTELQRIHQEIVEFNGDGPKSIEDELNLRFVRMINQTGSSRILRSILQLLSGSLPGSFYAESPKSVETERLYRERMLSALSARDMDEAAEVATEHLLACRAITLEVLHSRNYWADNEQAEARESD